MTLHHLPPRPRPTAVARNPYEPTAREQAIVEVCRDMIHLTALRLGEDPLHVLDDAAHAANYLLDAFLDAHVEQVQLGKVTVTLAHTIGSEVLASDMDVKVTPFGWTTVGDVQGATILALWALSLATGRTAGLCSRHTAPSGTVTVRAWGLRGDRIEPLDEDDVVTAFTTNARTGEPTPKEDGVLYAAGFQVPLNLDAPPAGDR